MGVRRVILLACLVGATAHAAPIDDAKAAFNAGKEAFERGDYETAIQQYEKANALVPSASLTYNIGTCYEHLGRFHPAAAAFQRYLELAGAPTTDDERDFQDKLRARIAADEKRAQSSAAAVTTPPPSTVYTPPPDYSYNPGPTREVRLQNQRSRRVRAIVLVALGGAMTIAGVGLLADGAVNPKSPCDTSILACSASSPGNAPSLTSEANILEDWAGITFIVVGTTLWAPGIASWVGAEHQIDELSQPEPKSEPAGAPKAMILRSPVFHF